MFNPTALAKFIRSLMGRSSDVSPDFAIVAGALMNGKGLVTSRGKIVTASVPLTAFSVTFGAGLHDETIALTPAGTLATGTVVFPTDAHSRLGQRLTIVSTQIITALTVTSTNLTLNGAAITALAANVPVTWEKTGAAIWTLVQPSATLGAASAASLAVSGNSTFGGSALVTGGTGGIGYGTGAGTAGTQATNRSGAITLAAPAALSGTITGQATSLAAGAEAIATVTATSVAIGDVVVLSVQSGPTANTSVFSVSTVAAGSFAIKTHNLHASTADTGAPILNFAIIKAVSA